ncbi:hypothetical protein [Fodinibius sp. Rm-B-1B1-1]|uniref:hypothetical protein n=1 Tax=Fodinibius alkaliphilus TaxID=3140241 RepID=UPI003159C333
MTTLKKTYRFAAAITVLLFIGNLVIPAGTAAFTLHCDMDMSIHSTQNCCEGSEMNRQYQSNNVDECILVTFCEQTVTTEQADVPAVIQHVNVVIAADLSGEVELLNNKPNYPHPVRDQVVDHNQSPPLFLLNSVFLN